MMKTQSISDVLNKAATARLLILKAQQYAH